MGHLSPAFSPKGGAGDGLAWRRMSRAGFQGLSSKSQVSGSKFHFPISSKWLRYRFHIVLTKGSPA